MTEIALISDIHGNRPALEAVLDDIARRGAELTYCLGDLVGYGPDPNGVIDVIREAGIPTIAGNYDDGVGWERGDCGCFYATPEAASIGAASYEFTVAAVTPERKAFLRELPGERHVTLGAAKVHLVHGSPRKNNEYLLSDRDDRTFLRLAEAETGDVLVFGHTHQAWQRVYKTVLFVNVGSVGRPKDGDPRAMYTTLRAAPGVGAGAASVQVEHMRVAYDVDAVTRAVLEVGLPPALAEAIREGR